MQRKKGEKASGMVNPVERVPLKGSRWEYTQTRLVAVVSSSLSKVVSEVWKSISKPKLHILQSCIMTFQDP